MRPMPDYVLGELIVHEVAQAIQFANLSTGHGLDRDDVEWEREAWLIELSWVFYPRRVACTWYLEIGWLIKYQGPAALARRSHTSGPIAAMIAADARWMRSSDVVRVFASPFQSWM